MTSGLAELLAFSGVMALGQFSPGPDMVLLTRTSLKSGVRAGVEMALGIACGLTVHATLAVAGLALAFDWRPSIYVGDNPFLGSEAGRFGLALRYTF